MEVGGLDSPFTVLYTPVSPPCNWYGMWSEASVIGEVTGRIIMLHAFCVYAWQDHRIAGNHTGGRVLKLLKKYSYCPEKWNNPQELGRCFSYWCHFRLCNWQTSRQQAGSTWTCVFQLRLLWMRRVGSLWCILLPQRWMRTTRSAIYLYIYVYVWNMRS